MREVRIRYKKMKRMGDIPKGIAHMSDLKEICKIFDFKDLGDERGNLVVIEGEIDIPFRIKIGRAHV